MSELSGILRKRGPNEPHVGNVKSFFWRFVNRDRGGRRSDLSWLSERLVSSHRRARASKAEPYWAWYERGQALRRTGRYQDALANFDRALELQPDYARAWHARGQTLADLGCYFDAVASYMTALKLEPTNAFVRLDRAAALANLKRQRQTAATGRPPARQPRPSLTTRHASP